MTIIRKLGLHYFLLYLTGVGLLSVSICMHASELPKLNIAVGWNKPPYVIQQTNTGFELELIKQIFQNLGGELKFIYVPYGRTHTLVQQKRVDAALTISRNLEASGLLLSDVYIEYQNVAITLTNKVDQVNNIDDLASFSIAAFQNANQVLGERFTIASQKSPMYLEVPDQYRQVEMLLDGKVDVLIMDANIFLHIARILKSDFTIDQVSIHHFFPSSEYRVGFHDRLLRDRFNQALQAYINSDQYQSLIAAYPMYLFSHLSTQ